MISYTYKLQIWTHCKSVPGTKKDVDHMFVDGDLTMRLHYFGLSRGPCNGKIYVPFRGSSQTFICKCNNVLIHRIH